MLKEYGKYIILILVCSIICLSVSAIVTIKLSSRMDTAEEETRQIIASARREESDQLRELREEDKIIEFKEPVQMAETTEVVLGQEAVINNTLTDASDSDDYIYQSTFTDAEMASLNDAPVDEEIQESNIEKNGKTVYLTFDDGPSDHTDEILDILDEYGVKATFFVVEEDGRHAKELKEIADRGHTIGIHSKSHIYSEIYADIDSFKADVEGVHDWVLSVTGIDTRYYRFPGGSSNNVSQVSIGECIEYLKSEGYEYYDWNAMSKDAENYYLTADELTENAMTFIRANEGDSIVLLHDLDEHYTSVESLPGLIEQLTQEGYSFDQIDDDTYPFHHYISSDNN
ncbi:MAG: polysaccharide deacetylase [Eubacterium sp.]|nr:polysaccharide deacetylase [Eubacterium sp.]